MCVLGFYNVDTVSPVPCFASETHRAIEIDLYRTALDKYFSYFYLIYAASEFDMLLDNMVN